MKRKIYTIEYGYRVNDFNVTDKRDYEYFCTNEENFLTKREYEKALLRILKSTMGNKTQQGYYIECYLDEEDITEEDIENIKMFNSLTDCSQKNTLIQSFDIFN